MTTEKSRPDAKQKVSIVATVQKVAGAVAARVLALPPVMRIQAILSSADAAGGGLLAAGLAFSALFALLPALLALVGISGYLITDPQARSALIAELVARFPPLAGPISDSLEQLVNDRAPFSAIAIVGLAWGASNFYGGLDTAMARLFPGGRTRGFIEQRVRGIVAIIGLVAAALGTVALGGAWAVVDSAISTTAGDLAIWGLIGPLLTIAVMILATLLTYRFVPTAAPSWRAALVPAIATGFAIGLLTSAFTLVAQRVIGVLAVFGVLAAIFAALIWLSYVFQLLIWGAAWARLRRDDEVGARAAARPAAGPDPGEGESVAGEVPATSP